MYIVPNQTRQEGGRERVFIDQPDNPDPTAGGCSCCSDRNISKSPTGRSYCCRGSGDIGVLVGMVRQNDYPRGVSLRHLWSSAL